MECLAKLNSASLTANAGYSLNAVTAMLFKAHVSSATAETNTSASHFRARFKGHGLLKRN